MIENLKLCAVMAIAAFSAVGGECPAQRCYVPPDNQIIIKGDELQGIILPEENTEEVCLDISSVKISFIRHIVLENEGDFDFRRVIFPESLSEIGDNAILFDLDSVALPESLKRIGKSAFQGGDIEHVDFPAGCAVVEEDAFRDNKISSFSWPAVDLYNFSGFRANNLTSLRIPSNVHSIGRCAFTDNPLRSLEFTEGLDTIGWGAFANFSHEYHNTNKYIPWDTAYVYTPLQTLTFPKSLKRISARAFYRARSLKSVDFADGLVSMGDEAFFACDSLESIVFPNSLLSVGNSAFSYCASLRHVELNDGLGNISPLAFCGCRLSGTLRIPGSLTEVGYRAFKDAFVQEENVNIIISEGVQSIGNQAFAVSLASARQPITYLSISLPSTLRVIEAYSFWGVWMEETPLPLLTESGDSLRWDAYLDDALVAEDVRTIGGLNRSGYTDFSRRSYVATVIDRKTSIQLTPFQPDVSVYDLNGRKIYQGPKDAIPPLRGIFALRGQAGMARLITH